MNKVKVREIDSNIKTLQQTISQLLQQREEALNEEVWPKKHTVYLHGDQETNFEGGQVLGLDENIIKSDFKYIGYEVAFDILVNEDGTHRVTHINNVDVSHLGISI